MQHHNKFPTELHQFQISNHFIFFAQTDTQTHGQMPLKAIRASSVIMAGKQVKINA